MASQKKFLVLGATGTLGSAVAQALRILEQDVILVGHNTFLPQMLGCDVANHRSVRNLAQQVQEVIGDEKLDGIFYGVSRHSAAECRHAWHEETEAFSQTAALAAMLSTEVIGMQIVLEKFTSLIRDGGKFAVASPTFAHQGHGDPSFWNVLESSGINLWPYVAVKRMQSEWLAARARSQSCRFAPVEIPARLIAEHSIIGVIPEGLPVHFLQRAYMFAQTACRQLLED